MRGIAKGPVLFVLFAIVATGIVLAYSMYTNNPLPYSQMPGVYKCDGFGLPDATFPRIWITPEMNVKGVADGKQFNVGRLAPLEKGAEMEYSMEAVHFSSFALDPFFAPRLAVFKNSLMISARKGEQEFSVTCEKIAQD